MHIPPWLFYALLSAFFASMVAILSKLGVAGINSNLATAVRTVVILLLAWGIVFYDGGVKQVKELTGWNLLFLVLSGIATGLSWLCYFKALQIGDVSKVAPIDKLSVALTIFLGITLFPRHHPARRTAERQGYHRRPFHRCRLAGHRVVTQR